MSNTKNIPRINLGAFIETFVCYKKGKTNLEEAALELNDSSCLPLTVCNDLLLMTKRENITQIWAHNKGSKQLMKSEKGKSDQDNL